MSEKNPTLQWGQFHQDFGATFTTQCAKDSGPMHAIACVLMWATTGMCMRMPYLCQPKQFIKDCALFFKFYE